MSITGERTSLGIVLAVILGGYTKSFFETGVDKTDNIGRQLSQDDVVGHRVYRRRESVNTKSAKTLISTFKVLHK